MEEICRLCCSTKFVNNYIFDEENALYLKMSLYLPIKVFKNDRLPQKVCDRCSCKVNDFYQFCNETIEVQNRLRAVLISSAVANIEIEDSVDLTHIKQDAHSPSLPEFTDQKVDLKLEQHRYQSTQGLNADLSRKFDSLDARLDIQQERRTCNQMTQTEDIRESNAVTIEIVKQEPTQPSQELVKSEVDVYLDDNCFGTNQSDNSEDDMSLIQFQKKKKSKKAKVSNGGIDKRKRKKELKEWDLLMQALPASTAVTVVNEQADVKVKQEAPDMNVQVSAGGGAVKAEPGAFHCCVCFHQCCSRTEIMKHYKQHASELEPCSPPAAPPPPPGGEHVKCTRCQKRLERSMWASHWSRHWERDRRPLRCALCEKTFRDHHQIFKHGLTHKMGEGGEPTTTAPESGLEKRFVCDVCPESFVYMRYLLSHRARAHPEAAARALALRCASCGRQFAHLNSLRRHLRAHTGERNFLCNICGKALSSREHLKFHIRIHTGYKPNVCKTCGKGFVKKCNLTLHERVHSGERPHVCPACGKAFSQRSTLVIHERYHSGARPYVCGLCQRGFVAKGLLSMHLKTTCI